MVETNSRAKKDRVQRSEADWKAILGEYDRSGQSRAAFCPSVTRLVFPRARFCPGSASCAGPADVPRSLST